MKSWIGAVLAWTIALAAMAVVAAGVVVPRLAGATPYTVTTGSMRPALPPGTLVVVKPTSFSALGIGDVVTYQLESGMPAVATHRVIAAGVNGHGERVLQTQGDANPTPDQEWVREVQVRGEVWYSVPYLGHLNTVLSNSQRQQAVYGVAVVLVGYALVMWAGAVRERTSRQKGEKNDDVFSVTATTQV